MIAQTFADIDECDEKNHNCTSTQVCVNSSPGFKCLCADGYSEGRTEGNINCFRKQFIEHKHEL